VIADYGFTLGGLIEFMKIFFGKMGIEDLRFKPSYSPYTEPSLEIFCFHEGLNKLVKIGNSGMFRPEMLEFHGSAKRHESLWMGTQFGASNYANIWQFEYSGAFGT